MNYIVDVKEEALQDIIETAVWYENRQEGLGTRFIENVIKDFKYLEHYPLSHQFKYKENRELLVKDFPYVLVYRVVSNKVIVLACASCNQHPSKKRKRKS